MAYSEQLAARVRRQLLQQASLQEKKMFGGLAFLLHGNMACGIIGDNLIVRVGPEYYHAALSRPRTREFDITGRPMNGWVMVIGQERSAEAELADWVARGVHFALSLAPK